MKQRLLLTDPSQVIFIPHSSPPKQVPPEGVVVDTSRPFWRRRIKEGSMIAAEDVEKLARAKADADAAAELELEAEIAAEAKAKEQPEQADDLVSADPATPSAPSHE